MNTEDELRRHSSQIARIEQVLTALAEAQVRSEDELAQFRQTMAEFQARSEARTKNLEEALTQLAKAQAQLTQAQATTETTMNALAQQFQAYLSTRKN